MSIYLIAKITGYSPSTVARALRNEGYCSKEKKLHILRVAKEINYTPNLIAKELRYSISKRIILGIPDIENPFYFKIIQGIQDAIEKKGYFLMLFNTKKQINNELEMINMLNQKFCDGIIWDSFNFCEKNIESLRSIKRPAVLLNNYSDQIEDDNFDCVSNQQTSAMKLATEHLIRRGCKNILLFVGDLNEQTAKDCLNGYTLALEKHSIPLRMDYVLDGVYSKDGAAAVFIDFIEKNKIDNLDGIVTANDLMAIGVLENCIKMNIEIPKNLKLVSLNNLDILSIVKPSISSVDLHAYEMGKKSGELLLERIEGRKTVSNYSLTPTLYVRKSTQL